jgi:hypothetical protein
MWDLVARHHLVDLVATDVQHPANSGNVDHIVVGDRFARDVSRRCASVWITIGEQRRERW